MIKVVLFTFILLISAFALKQNHESKFPSNNGIKPLNNQQQKKTQPNNNSQSSNNNLLYQCSSKVNENCSRPSKNIW